MMSEGGGVGRWLQRLAWRVGRPFCEVPSDELDRKIQDQDIRHFAALHILRTEQAEDRRLLAEGALAIARANAHMADCDQRHDELDRQVEHLKQEYFELFKQVTKAEEPPALRLMGDG